VRRQPFKSSHIKSAGFNEADGEIEVEFRKGNVYRYSECNEAEFKALCNARSPGSFFHRFIRRKKSRKLEAE
jgi:hypothetical protein